MPVCIGKRWKFCQFVSTTSRHCLQLAHHIYLGQRASTNNKPPCPCANSRARQPPPPPALMPTSDGPGQGASTTRFRFSGYPSWGRCDPNSAAAPLPSQVLHTWSCGGCDVLWQASPVSRPADLVPWSSGSALTSCIMSRIVHLCLCRCGTVWDVQHRHCLWVSLGTPLTAKRRAHSAPGQYHEITWCVCVCVCVCVWVCVKKVVVGFTASGLPRVSGVLQHRVQRGGACDALHRQLRW